MRRGRKRHLSVKKGGTLRSVQKEKKAARAYSRAISRIGCQKNILNWCCRTSKKEGGKYSLAGGSSPEEGAKMRDKGKTASVSLNLAYQEGSTSWKEVRTSSV